ncbi:MAG TPA: hypothetical protein VFK17_06810 [Gaiellaceae bacterium]|nr:hypothetical protein [Gaiellaceae bacterium]
MRRGLAVLLAFATCAAGALGAPRPKPHVTLVADSVGAALAWDGPAARIFARGLDADLELKGCRRLVTASCAVGGAPAPESALETIRRLGARVGPSVVIDVGYNDYPTVYAPGIEQVLRALRAAHVEHVFWVTLHASRGAYLHTNSAILGAARRHPEMTVIDWNACAAGHADWFAEDGLHLTGAGAQGHAACLHDAVVAVLRIEVSLSFPPGATPGFHAVLHARGGTPPYRFAVRGLPRGLHASPAGSIHGSLDGAGRFLLQVTVRDAAGRRTAASIPLVVSS